MGLTVMISKSVPHSGQETYEEDDEEEVEDGDLS